MQTVFETLCQAHGLPRPIPEHRFAPPRRWRFDWAWVEHSLALEIEGGIWTRGRHTRGKGFLNDVAKYNQAVVLGWRVIRTTPAQVEDGQVFETLRQCLQK